MIQTFKTNTRPLKFRKFYWLLLIFALQIVAVSQASIVGTPPITKIDIPFKPYSTYFDLAQDQNNVIYVSYDEGVKVYDGVSWHTVEIPNTYLTRRLLFDQVDRVYVGGYDFFGYIKRNDLGIYEFIDLTPDETNPFGSIWDIALCQQKVYFKALHQVYEWNPTSQTMSMWTFNGKLGAITCHHNQPLLQDRSVGLIELLDGQWQNNPTQLKDNALIYEFGELGKNRLFLRSASDSWRIIENNQPQTISFNDPLPSLGSFSTSHSLAENKMVMGTNNGHLTFIDFENLSSESFKLSSDWIATIIQASDGGLLVLSDYKVYHLVWPTPWRIQGSDTGLSSDIFDVTYWNDELYALSRAGVFKELNNSPTQQQRFMNLNWTDLEAWHLLPVNEAVALFADSHHMYEVSSNGLKPISEIIYPRLFQKSKYRDNHFYVLTELDTRLLIYQDNNWQDTVIHTGKPISLVELNESELYITTIEDQVDRVQLNPGYDGAIKTNDRAPKLNITDQPLNGIIFFYGPDQKIFATNNNQYFELINQQLITTDFYGLDKLLPAEKLYDFKIDAAGVMWAQSDTQVFKWEHNKWKIIEASPYLHGGILDMAMNDSFIKLSSNGLILTYIKNQPSQPPRANGKLMITSALVKSTNEQIRRLPLNHDEALILDANPDSITIKYSFTDFVRSPWIEYQHRLTGHNENWSPFSKNTQANFLKLPAGNYAFEVRAKDIKGQLFETGPLSFVVEPVWYLTSHLKLLWLLLISVMLVLLVNAFIKWREKIHEAQKAALENIIDEKTKALELANQALQNLAHKDSLTGLSNRLFLDKYIKQLIDNKVENVAVMMIDMDHFKHYNDTHGHLAGDELLEKFSASLTSQVKRKQDLLARYGGEEFLVIMPNTTQDFALRTAENIRNHTAQQKEKTTVSIGITYANGNQPIRSAKDIFLLIDQADQALYEAKSNGRNQVIKYAAANIT